VAPQPYETMFYEVMWRTWARGIPYPMPWWLQSYFRQWPGDTSGMFGSKEAGLASNALYRYWNMVGVKDAHQESVVGQAGEVEPVYERYAMTFFLIADGKLHFPHFAEAAEASAPTPTLAQKRQDGYLPVVSTVYRPPLGVSVEQRTLSTVVGVQNHVAVLNRLLVQSVGAGTKVGQLGVAIIPVKPSGFVRYNKNREPQASQLAFLRYLPAERRLETNTRSGPVFLTTPGSLGLYGNENSVNNPDHYLSASPFAALAAGSSLNAATQASDPLAGLCSAVFLWPFDVSGGQDFQLNIWLPVDDFRGAGDFADLTAQPADSFETTNAAWWRQKLDGSGMQVALPPVVDHLWAQYRSSRADLLILADDGAIHPGPTIYDSFWIRDSSVEAIACALAGDDGLAGSQLGRRHLQVFQTGGNCIGPASAYGFFGGEHEQDGYEWDANGEALWAFGKFDRIQGSQLAFGAKVYWPYVLQGARWIRDNRSSYGIMLSGWSAEHIGDRDQPHYWDDLWGLAGLYEAARIAERIGANEVAELWGAFDSLKAATAASIRWVLGQQRNEGEWETYVPSGPGGDRGLYSTIIGAAAYFHPTRLYYGAKLGDDIDRAFRFTLETIWSHFVDGGFRHDSSWQAYGPYLTLQLAHAFLLIGDVDRMDALLGWTIGNAGYARVSRYAGATEQWQVTTGTWNEQHAYPVANDFSGMPFHDWYMGDIPHGWAAAEFMLLLHDMLLYEAGEDDIRELYIAPGIPPRWLRGGGGQSVTVTNAATTYSTPLSYTLQHDESNARVTIDITQPIAGVTYVYPCRLGLVTAVSADGVALSVAGRDVRLPAGTSHAVISYA
jgi:hypothetical protein